MAASKDSLKRDIRGILPRIVLIFSALFVAPARAAEIPVNIELLLALDASASVDRKEFELQLKGIALAFRDEEVLEAVENLKPLGVAIAVSQWGGPGESRVIIPFTHIEGARDAKAFGFIVGRSYRFIGATSTSIVTAIEDGIAVLDQNRFDGQRRVIDVSGDGRDNSNLSLEQARAEAKAAGVTVNGLAIEADESGLTAYYRNNVIAGAGSFVETAAGFEDFARAIKIKLLRELRPLGS
jgi:hypothetical protein